MYITTLARYDCVMNANNAPAVRRTYAIDVSPAEFNDAIANSAFAPANVTLTNAPAFDTEIVFDATRDDLAAYAAFYDLPADELDDIFVSID